MARKKTPGTKPVTVVEIVCYKFAFESVTKAAEVIKLLASAIQVERYIDPSGDFYLIPIAESDDRREASIELAVNQPFRSLKALPALPERGTHPALFDPKLA